MKLYARTHRLSRQASQPALLCNRRARESETEHPRAAHATNIGAPKPKVPGLPSSSSPHARIRTHAHMHARKQAMRASAKCAPDPSRVQPPRVHQRGRIPRTHRGEEEPACHADRGIPSHRSKGGSERQQAALLLTPIPRRAPAGFNHGGQ